jgi:hypothetical protein
LSIFSEEEQIKHRSIAFTAVLVILQFCCPLRARPITAYKAEKVVAGWLKADGRPFGTVLGRRGRNVLTFTDDSGEPIYYIVNLQPRGFVIVSADDLIEPIIGFADDGIYNPSPDNPLGALVTGDLKGRAKAVRGAYRLQAITEKQKFSGPQGKWDYFISLGEASDGGYGLMNLATLSDICVPPLLQSKWSQATCGTDPPLDCYNYHTPEHYRCGCAATAMAQLMRYHQYPDTPIGAHYFAIKVDGVSHMFPTLGGDGFGGTYNWSRMVLIPGNETTEAQREAIGALCYDAGIAINTEYDSDKASADTSKARDALTTTFKYGNAVSGYNSGENIGSGLIDMINPNLDAKKPVILGVKGTGGHALVCDGYGYNLSTMYHHLNMGWAGYYDAWYNLPTIDSAEYYSSVYKCIYNIHTVKGGDGEVLSGRILDHNGEPIVGAVVYAEPLTQAYQIAADSDENGIYAFDSLNSNTTYTIWPSVEGYVFSSQNATTGISYDDAPISGNVWGIDFVAFLIGDLDGDGDVDTADFAVFASAWLTGPADAQWNPDCDISIPADNFIDTLDLTVFVDTWLTGVK